MNFKIENQRIIAKSFRSSVLLWELLKRGNLSGFITKHGLKYKVLSTLSTRTKEVVEDANEI